ncbi:MAG: hypothetical protein AAF170_19670, partial [Bacteroidota bacterium]
MSNAPSRALAPILAGAGLALFAGAIVWAFSYLFRSPPAIVNLLIWVGLVLGVVLQIGAIGVSLWGARKRGGIPVVASLYGLAVLAAIGAWVYNQYEVRQWYRDNPEAFSVDWNEAGTEVGVRTGEGVWWVPVDQCPNVEDETLFEMGTQSRDGYVEVSVNSEVPHMRLYVAEQRVECLQTNSPLGDADLASALAAALEVEALRPHLPEGDTLLLAGWRLPALDSVRVVERPARTAEGWEVGAVQVRFLDPQPDRVEVELEIYQPSYTSARVKTARLDDGSWEAS